MPARSCEGPGCAVDALEAASEVGLEDGSWVPMCVACIMTSVRAEGGVRVRELAQAPRAFGGEWTRSATGRAS